MRLNLARGGENTPTKQDKRFGLCLCYLHGFALDFRGASKVGATGGGGCGCRGQGGALLRPGKLPLAPYRTGRWLRRGRGWLRRCRYGRSHYWLRRRRYRQRLLVRLLLLLLQDLLVIDGAHQGGGMLAGMHDDLAGSVAVRQHPVHLNVAT